MGKVVLTNNAQAVAQVTTTTIAGTWVAAETVTLTINDKDITVTVGTAVTVTDVAAAIVAAVNGAALVGDESRNTTGNLLGEFYSITATNVAGVITLTGSSSGRPFTVTVSETSTSGTISAPSTSTNPTGPNHWDNADNWDTGAVPVSTDDVIIDGRAKGSILYGLDQSAVTLTSLHITKGFATPFTIGLPSVNSDRSNLKYPEYLDQYLQISATNVVIGEGAGSGSGRIKLDTGINQTTVVVYATGTTAESGIPSLLFLGTHASNALYGQSGDIGIAFFEEELATVATLECSNATMIAGSGCTLTNVAMGEGSGILDIDAATTTVEQEGGTLNIRSGVQTSLKVFEGVCNYLSADTITTLEVTGTIDFALDPRSRTVTNVCQVYAGARINDPGKTVTWSAGLKVNHKKLADVDLDLGADRTYTVA